MGTVRTLVEHLRDIGIPGDEALDCAVAAARDCGGSEVSAESITALLTRQRGPSPHRSVTSSTSTFEPRHRTAFRRADWVFTPSTADGNVERPPSTRTYFSTPDREPALRHPYARSASPPHLGQRSRSPSPERAERY